MHVYVVYIKTQVYSKQDIPYMTEPRRESMPFLKQFDC